MSAAAELLSRGQALGLLAGFAALAAGVWCFQNQGERLGGRISWIKAVWLAYAIVLWIALPLVLVGSGVAFVFLSVSMGVRVLVEVPLCLVRRWRVVYGVAHDLLHAAVVLFAMGWYGFSGFNVWGWLTLVSLASELTFVRWFVKATGGPGEGVYFVPGGEGFRKINQRTAIVVLPQVLCFVGLLAWACRGGLGR